MNGDKIQPRALTIEDDKLSEARHEAWMRVRSLAIRAHQICNLVRIAHPEVAEVADDGCLHEAIHDLMRVDWPDGSAGR